MFSENESIRYSRHFTLPNVGKVGQIALKNSRVLCVGAGGLGAPTLLYLAAAGIGTLGIVDDDIVELSNLQRQVLYSEEDIGKNKAECARKKLNQLNANIHVIPYAVRLKKNNVLKIMENYDVIVDGTDNLITRYIIGDASFYLNKPMVYASIFRFEGQCSVFLKDCGPCYRCLFPSVPKNYIPNCAEMGVLGILPGLLGCIQANEVIKFILKIGSSLIGKLLTVDLLSLNFQTFNIHKNKHCILCAHQQEFAEIAYEDAVFCPVENIQELTIADIYLAQEKKEPLILLDIRERSEHEAFNIGGDCVPLEELKHSLNKLDPNKKTIIYCNIGESSKVAAAMLKHAGFVEVYSLKSGVLGLESTAQ